MLPATKVPQGGAREAQIASSELAVGASEVRVPGGVLAGNPGRIWVSRYFVAGRVGRGGADGAPIGAPGTPGWVGKSRRYSADSEESPSSPKPYPVGLTRRNMGRLLRWC